MTSTAKPIATLQHAQQVLLLRWVLIIATSYLVLFSRPIQQTPPSVAIFIAAYLASNIALTALVSRIRSQRLFDAGVVILDTIAVSIGLALTDNASSDFFLLYFVVMFLGALSGRLGLVVGAAVMISGLHMYTMSRFVGFEHLLTDGYVLRIPFLFVVALFFGHLVENTRRSERDAEAARSRERMRAEFISTVTHDLKNPLGLVQTMADLLLAGEAGALTERQTDLVRRMHANVRRVISLSLNLLDAARIESGRLMLQRTPAKLGDVVDDALSLARSASELKGITLGSSNAADVPTLDIDFMQMERVISNLLDNAIKYTPGGGTVTTAITYADGHVVLAVGDNGPGIPADDVPVLFEKYRRLAASTGADGTGLGLFIVKAIVDAHGGSIDVESVVDRGTTVTVRIPVTRSTAESALDGSHPIRRTRLQRLLGVITPQPLPAAVPVGSPPR